MANRIGIKETDLKYEFLGKLLVKGARFYGAVAEAKKSAMESAPVEKNKHRRQSTCMWSTPGDEYLAARSLAVGIEK